MTLFAVAIKRLYDSGKIGEGKILSLFEQGKISLEEKNEILGVGGTD